MQVETAAACGDDDALEDVRQAAIDRHLAAEWGAKRAILDAMRPCAVNDWLAPGCPSWPSRGVRCGGILYALRPDRDGEDRFLDEGEAPDEVRWS